MPRATIVLQCEVCLDYFETSQSQQKLCKICRDAKEPSSEFGQKYTLVKCDDFLDFGMIGHKNTLKIWMQLRVTGAILEYKGIYIAYTGIGFQPCDNPYPPAKSGATWYKAETGWHTQRSSVRSLTQGGIA